MGVRDLFFSIKARDETGAAFASVKKNLRDVDGMTATASQRFNRAGKSLMTMGAIGTAAFAPIAFAFRDSLSLYDIQERAQAKVRQGIAATGQAAGFTADELFRQASAMQSLTRFGDEEILNGVTAQLLTFTNIAGDQFLNAQTAALNLATVLDGDLQSASIMLGKALNDPVKGLSAMSRAGITFSEDQAKVIKSLAKTGDMAAAQTMILNELEKQYGGQAQAAAEAGLGAMDQLSNSWGDLKESVGGVIAEILPPMVDFFQTGIEGFLALPDPVKKGAVAIGFLTLAAGPAAIALGALSIAAGAISVPFLLAVGGVAAVVGITAALWPEADEATRATDNLVLALGDELIQSQLLSTALGTNAQMSVQVAQKKLAEAKARYKNVQAIYEEKRALGLESADRVGVGEMSMSDDQAARFDAEIRRGNSQTGDGSDIFDPRAQAIYENRVTSGGLEDPTFSKEHRNDLDEIQGNIDRIDNALANAKDGVVTFGAAMVDPIKPGERLADVEDRIAAATRNVNVETAGLGGSLKKVTTDLDTTKKAMDGFGQETADLLKDVFADGRVTMDDFGDFVLAWGDRLLDRMLTSVFDPMGDAIQGLFDNMGSGGGFNLFGGGSTGSGGGLFGGFFKNLLGFDTGGEMQVTGRNGIDRNVAAFRVSADENIKVVKRGQDSGGQVNVYIQTPNPSAFTASKGQIAAQIGRAVGHGQRFA